MKSCRRCFESVYVFVGGDVRICCFNDVVIGNLTKNTLEEIWNSDKANDLRQAFVKGELKGCWQQYCPDCINGTEELNFEQSTLEELYKNMPNLPSIISMAYDERCNRACPSCRHAIFKPDKS